jgi:CheY-like chemotaxis protein
MLPLAGAAILLAEDHPLNQQVAEEFLTKLGLRVSIANNGQEAVDLAQSQHFDAVLMDLHMPVLDGYAATSAIRSLPNAKRLPVIAMTAAVMPEDRLRCQQVGMVDFVAKPVEPQELVNVLLRRIDPTGIRPPAVEVAAPVDRLDSPVGAPGVSLPYGASGFDMPAAVARLSGDENMLGRLLLRFAEDYQNAAEDLQRLLETDQAQDAREWLHALKGVAGNLGISALAESARQLEKTLKDGGDCRSLLASGSLKTFQQALADSLSTLRQSSTEVVAPSSSYSREELLALLRQLPHYLREQELLPENLFAALQASVGLDAPNLPIARLVRQLDNFDHAGALATLQQLAELQQISLDE